MQRVESDTDIQVAVVDETYFSDEEDWEERREKFRLDLENEFGFQFEDADVGPSASLPAFVTFIAENWEWIGPSALAIFFGGKRVEDSWNWWVTKAKMLRRLGKKKQIKLNRNGAAIIAVEAVMHELSATPSGLKLLRYGIAHMSEADDLKSFDVENEKEGPTDTLYLGFINHVFEIEADGNVFRVRVDGAEVEVSRVD
ncbi:hypothetical protein [Qipengyuania atrilutea]|uniref:Uncharacterized protein n=1 Tax=Qipengyuania atrilutea TaxID=2744473 RepID=A0A850H3E3_9SPHN|nr:hypothetical protein [Actirhodobacter atriluteus]NVD45110.1 hypothetical protein [Actirhodobacter atriluteus]